MADADAFLAKAEESLASAEDDFAKGRFNSCARNAYYAAFQVAVAALLHAGIQAPHSWGHGYVAGRFSAILMRQRRIYPPRFRRLLPDALELRTNADYSDRATSTRKARDTLSSSREVVTLVRERIHGDS